MLSFRTPEYAVRRMVRAISSAIDNIVFLNSSNPIGSESREAMAQTSITMLPEASSCARAPAAPRTSRRTPRSPRASRGVARSARERMGVVCHPA